MLLHLKHVEELVPVEERLNVNEDKLKMEIKIFKILKYSENLYLKK